MKKIFSLMALSVFTGIACAQTAVTIYGLVDVDIVSERGGAAGPVLKETSGAATGSRLGFKGTEDLGGGLSALFVLESGFNANDGTLGQGGLAYGRQAFVGFAGGFGKLTLGRQYSPEFLTLAAADPFVAGTAGDAANLFPLTGAGGRMANAVMYVSPSLNGFTGELAYGFGNVTGDAAAGRQLGAAVGYASGPFMIRLGYHNKNNDTSVIKNLENAKNTTLAVTYDFGVAKIHFGYGDAKGPNSSLLRNTANPFGSPIAPVATTDSSAVLLGVTVPFGSDRLLASYIRKNDRTALNQDADQLAIGYFHSLSKLTELYGAIARINNKNGAGYTDGAAIDAGTGDRSISFGLRHSFNRRRRLPRFSCRVPPSDVGVCSPYRFFLGCGTEASLTNYFFVFSPERRASVEAIGPDMWLA